MSQERYTIYVVERKHPKEGFYHSSLIKIREDKQSGCMLDRPKNFWFWSEEIHFDIDCGYMDAFDQLRQRNNDPDVMFQGYVNGDREYIEDLWRRLYRVMAAVARDGKIPFEFYAKLEHQFNCRSGTEAGLNAMGFRYVLDDEKLPRQGLGKNLLDRLLKNIDANEPLGAEIAAAALRVA
jgi:hypothetical protein